VIRPAEFMIRRIKLSTIYRIRSQVTIWSMLTVASGHAAVAVTATTNRPITVMVTQVVEIADAGGLGCNEAPRAVLRVRLRQLTGGAGLLVRVFLDEAGAVAAGSSADSVYAGMVALAPSDTAAAQEFFLPLPLPIQSPWRGRATIAPALNDGAGEPTASVSIEDVSLVRTACR
jgi:hypothetical protein